MHSNPIASTTALARHLGLSRWTISRVLNGHPDVRPETTRRVRDAMDELGFVPSPAGRALRGMRSGMIGACFQALGSPIVARKIGSLQNVVRRAGFRALFEVTDGRPDLELEVVRNFAAMRVDGLVMVGGITPENAAAIVALVRQQQLPIVLVDPVQRFELPTVELDRPAGMRFALEHLRGLGHLRIALLGIDESVPYGRVRCAALQSLASRIGMPWDSSFLPISEPDPAALDFAYGSRLADRVLSLRPRPTAIIALNDQVAIGAMSRIQHAGLEVPREMSIVGFDNLDVSAHVNPRLTTVDQRVDELMQCAVDLIAGQCSGTDDDEAATAVRAIVPRFIEGESTGPAVAPPAG